MSQYLQVLFQLSLKRSIQNGRMCSTNGYRHKQKSNKLIRHIKEQKRLYELWRLTTGLFRGSYVNDPEEKFWHCLLKEMIFTIRVSFCGSGLASTSTNASTRSYDTGLCVVLKRNHCFLVSLFKFERAFLGYR